MSVLCVTWHLEKKVEVEVNFRLEVEVKFRTGKDNSDPCQEGIGVIEHRYRRDQRDQRCRRDHVDYVFVI